MNGTVMAQLQLALDGRPNRDGLLLTGLIDRHGQHHNVGIDDGQFLGIETTTGRPSMRGAALIGSRLALERHSRSDTIERLSLAISGLATEPYMSNEPGSVPGYFLEYGPASGHASPLCPDGGPAVVVAGEHYAEATLAIGDGERAGASAGQEQTWFSLACRDQLLAKARRMSYRPGLSGDDPYATTRDERRATLAMLAADYCGNGRRFTVPATPVSWSNRRDWMVVGARRPASTRLEAGWTADGAVCLDTPRLPETYTRADVEAACGQAIPACSEQALAASDWITWVPEIQETIQ